METLQGLVRAFSELALKLVEAEGQVLSPEIEKELDLVADRLPQKIDNYGHLMDRLELECEFIDKRIAQLRQLSDKIESARLKLEQRMFDALKTVNDKTLVGNEFKFKLSPTAGRTIVDESQVPMAYWKTDIVKSIDKAKIKAELNAGKKVPGCKIEESWSFRKTISSKLLKG